MVVHPNFTYYTDCDKHCCSACYSTSSRLNGTRRKTQTAPNYEKADRGRRSTTIPSRPTEDDEEKCPEFVIVKERVGVNPVGTSPILLVRGRVDGTGEQHAMACRKTCN